MVAKKAKAVMRMRAVRRDAPTKKLRIGVLVGKDFDPVKKGLQGDYPKKYCLTEDDWGKYSVDTATALKMQQLHPDLLEVDIMQGKDMKEQRLKKNHLNISFWYEAGAALMTGRKKHFDEVLRCHKNPECRLDPSWDYYIWIMCKPNYMEQCMKAGIPMIPTIIYKDGFDPHKCLRDVQKKGWDKFFVKLGQFAFFGEGAIHGKTADFLAHRFKDLEAYANTNKNSKTFLLQPYMLKPNGEVFDEVRNYFIDGKWRYSVFTHGTDESDRGYYQEPEGPRKAACKALAERAYREALKVSTWQGKRKAPLLNRIDIGVMPRKGGQSLHKADNVYFVNEVESICSTWLDRYAPISVSDAMAQATVKHSLELLVGLLNSKAKMLDRALVKRVTKELNERVGPLKHIKIKA